MRFEDYMNFIDRTPLAVRLIIVICLVTGVVVASFVSPTAENVLPAPWPAVSSTPTNQPLSDDFGWYLTIVVPLLGL